MVKRRIGSVFDPIHKACMNSIVILFGNDNLGKATQIVGPGKEALPGFCDRSEYTPGGRVTVEVDKGRVKRWWRRMPDRHVRRIARNSQGKDAVAVNVEHEGRNGAILVVSGVVSPVR